MSDSGEREAHQREMRCPHGRAYNGKLCKVCRPRHVVFVPISLAQRILSALDHHDGIECPASAAFRALAAELRERMPP